MAEWVILGKALYLEIKGGVFSQRVWQEKEWGEEVDFSSHLPQSHTSVVTLVGGPGGGAARKAGRESSQRSDSGDRRLPQGK